MRNVWFENIESIPDELYVIWWRDRLHPEHCGFLWVNNTVGAPFLSFKEAEEAAKRISFRQETKIIKWRLEIIPEVKPTIEEKRRQVLKKMKSMTTEELFQLAVRAGIYTENGELTEHYVDKDDNEKLKHDP